MRHAEQVTNEHDPMTNSMSMFDGHGRCVPSGVIADAHNKSRRYFVITQPRVGYADIFARIGKHLGMTLSLSAREFEQRAEAILQNLKSDPNIAGIADGVGVPFILPCADYADYGETLETIYLEAVRSSFSEKFPSYSFVNHSKGGLAGKFSIAPGSRHELLLASMRQEPVVGYYFPCLTEYSVPAAIERIATLPEKFLLAGGFDTAAAVIGSPDLLLRNDGYPPVLWLAALLAESNQIGYHFEAYGYNLNFNRRAHFGQAAESWASGLVVLG